MSEEAVSTTLFTESPASWNTRYITQDGFTCQLTLRSESGKELLEKANSALAYLREQGCIPFYGYQKNSNQDDNNRDANTKKDNNNTLDPTWCPIHEVEMKRYEKNGAVWFSHKTPDGWCNGKVKNGKKE